MKTSRLLLLSTSLLLAAACGTKGPLVLPGKETPARQVEPIELPDDADAMTDAHAPTEPADAAEPPAPPAED